MRPPKTMKPRTAATSFVSNRIVCMSLARSMGRTQPDTRDRRLGSLDVLDELLDLVLGLAPALFLLLEELGVRLSLPRCLGLLSWKTLCQRCCTSRQAAVSGRAFQGL